MKIRVQRHDGALLLELDGELDADGSAALEERCLYEQQEGAFHFVVDLAAVKAITGPGLRVLLALARNLPRSGGSLVLCALERRVDEALRVSGLGGSFDLAPDRDAALRRSQELQATRRPAQPVSRAEAEERIDYAIALLGARNPG